MTALHRDVDRHAPFRVQTRGGCPHDVLAGTWTDPYTGERRTFTDLKQPDQAIPIDHRAQCDFATRYVVIKSRWSLTVDPPEKAALADMLRRCP